MKKLLLSSICILVFTSAALAESAKVITLVSKPGTNATLEIPAGQAARIVTLAGSPPGNGAATITKEGIEFDNIVGLAVEGPATFKLYTSQGTPGAMMTLERWRVPKVIPLLLTK